MSKKEESRRQFCRRVMKYAWRLFKKGGGWLYSFANYLKLAWRSLKGVDGFRHSKVVGVTFYNSINEGGANRQKVIAALLKYPKEMISIYLKREADNIYDPRAIAVYAGVKDKGSAMIGYLNRDEAYILAPRMDVGNYAITILEDITGGGSYNYGVNISYTLLQ